MNLAITDGFLTSLAMTSAIEKYGADKWIFGDFGCKLLSYAQFVMMLWIRKKTNSNKYNSQ